MSCGHALYFALTPIIVAGIALVLVAHMTSGAKTLAVATLAAMLLPAVVGVAFSYRISRG